MSTFLNNVDVDTINKLVDETTNNVEIFQNMVDKVVRSYSESLDNLMNAIYKDIIVVDQAPLNTLENYFLELSNMLYFMGDKLERLGVYDVMSKNAYKEIYNTSYLGLSSNVTESKKKPTVAELTAQAESDAQYEGIVNDIYAKAYKIVKSKIESANTMLSAISKIISKRMSEMQLNSVTPTGKQILNENINNVNSTGSEYVISPSSYSNVF